MTLSEKERGMLKAIARQAMEGVLFGRGHLDVELTDNLKAMSGAFVTVNHGDELRGCIGYIRGVMPLHQAVREMAVQAAFHDPRFPPVGKDEYKDIDIEISVLTPLKKVEDVSEIEVGVHGLYIEAGGYAGLLLPQVAREYGWDRITFLEHTCYKAGLSKDAWKLPHTAIYVFSAEVF